MEKRKNLDVLEDGLWVKQVPLGKSSKIARIDPEDYALLMDLGVSANWFMSNGHVCVKIGKSNEPVSRVLLDCKDETVTYRNGDRRDLRRANLVAVKGLRRLSRRARANVPYPNGRKAALKDAMTSVSVMAGLQTESVKRHAENGPEYNFRKLTRAERFDVLLKARENGASEPELMELVERLHLVSNHRSERQRVLRLLFN